eukprot:4864611-Prymnesium_polylepis.1
MKSRGTVRTASAMMPSRSPGCPKHPRASTGCGRTAEKMEAGCSRPLKPQSRTVRKRMRSVVRAWRW